MEGNDAVTVNLLFFAKSREIVGHKQARLQLPRTVSGRHILKFIIREYPDIGLIANSIVLSLNEEYLEVDSDIQLRDGDEIAVIPPISGGYKLFSGFVSIKTMDFVDVVEDKLSVEAISDQVSSESCGAVSMFVGTTRDNFDGKKVLRLDYEAYMPMARKKMLAVCADIRQKWDVHNIAIIHRIGVVPVKEASIVIAISSAHRKESLEAVHYAIDTVKATVPVWKKEIYEDESSAWKQNKECAWSKEMPISSDVEKSQGCSSKKESKDIGKLKSSSVSEKL